MAIRPMTEEEKFEALAVAFGHILLANARTWAGHRKQMTTDQLKGLIANVRVSCVEMQAAVDLMHTQPIRTLTDAEYEAKVAAGKKITYAKEGERMKKED